MSTMAQLPYRRRSDPAAASGCPDLLSRLGRASLLLLGLALVVVSCFELTTLVGGGLEVARPLAPALGARAASPDLVALLPALLLPVGAVLSFVASSFLRCRPAR